MKLHRHIGPSHEITDTVRGGDIGSSHGITDTVRGGDIGAPPTVAAGDGLGLCAALEKWRRMLMSVAWRVWLLSQAGSSTTLTPLTVSQPTLPEVEAEESETVL